MQLSHPPSQRIFLISFVIGVAALAVSIVGFGLVDDLMILAIVWVYYAAAHYRRAIFRICLLLTISLSLPVSWLTIPQAQVPSAALTTGLFALTTLISSEYIFSIREAQRRVRREARAVKRSVKRNTRRA